MIQRIQTYREGDEWLFDDRDKHIEKEPFVAGIPELFDLVTGDPEATILDLTFSAEPFEGAVAVNYVREELDGVVYEFRGREGWLCPVFWLYLSGAPKVLYAKVEVIETAKNKAHSSKEGR